MRFHFICVADTVALPPNHSMKEYWIFLRACVYLCVHSFAYTSLRLLRGVSAPGTFIPGMTYFDKSKNVGYDARDNELNGELEAMMERVAPHEQRKLLNRVHDGIIQRMREESTRKCWTFIQKYEQCVNTTNFFTHAQCIPHRDALNDCVHEVNSEENYQKYRVAFLRGELLKLHEERLSTKVEALKQSAPGVLPNFKMDYAPRFAETMANLEAEPTGTIAHDDLRKKK